MLDKVEEDRLEEIMKQIGEIISSVEDKDTDEMWAYIEQSSDYVTEELHDLLKPFFTELREKQLNGDFGKLNLVCVSPSDVELFNHEYKLRIYAYDERRLDSRREFFIEWNPEYFTKYYVPNVEIIEKELPGRMYRLTSREFALIKLIYADRFAFYLALLLDVFKDIFAQEIEATGLEKDMYCFLSCGRYLSDAFVNFYIGDDSEE